MPRNPPAVKASTPEDPPGAALGGMLVLISLLFLPLIDGGYSGTGYQVGFVLLPLAACVSWFVLERRPLVAVVTVALFLATGLGLYGWVQEGRVLWFSLLAAPAAWIAVWTLLTRVPSRRFWLLPVITTSSVLTALYGWFLWLGNGNLHYQLTATFGLHNSYAGYLLLAWPSAMVAAYLEQRAWLRWLYLAAGLFLAVTLVLTYSRASWVAFAVQIITVAAYLAWQFTRQHFTARQLGWGIAALGGLVLTLLALPPVRAVLPTLLNFQDYSMQGRLRFWQAALEIFRDHPLFGVGLGNFAYVYPQYQRDYIYYSVDPHSWVLQLAAELGLVGVLAVVAVLAGFVTWLRRSWRGLQAGPVALLLACAVGGSLLHATVDFDYTFSATTALLGALLALGTYLAQPGATLARTPANASSLPHSSTGTDARPAPRRAWLIVLGNLAGLLLFAAALGGELLTAERFYLDELANPMLEPKTKLDLLWRAVKYNPLNHRTRYQLASLLAQPGPLRAPDGARQQVDWALQLNPLYAPAWVLKGLLTKNEQDVATALKLDPYNYPEHYWFYATLAKDPAVRRARLLDGLQHIPLTEPVTPEHVRPTWYNLNPLFAQWYYELARVETDSRQADAYRQVGAKFEAYWSSQQAQAKLDATPAQAPGTGT
jgi:O-antigen ligase